MALFWSPALCLISLLFAFSVAQSESDRVHSLPDYGIPPAPQWSGFLNASAAESGTYLHYWFSYSTDVDPATAPVVLWLNGGPGSSSIIGMLQEQGPLLMNATGGLMDNPYAWTKLANLLVLESPAGVGYSYCAASLSGGSCSNTDKSTAAAARAAIQDFFTVKFPALVQNKFFITGESYAGVYVPTLAREIVDHAPEINLVGVGVGDPCTDNEAQKDSMDMLWYGHKYGFVPDAQFDYLWNNCSTRHSSPISAGKWTGKSVKNPAAFKSAHKISDTPECKLAYRKYLSQTSRAFSQEWKNGYINDVTLYGPFAIVGWDQPGSLNYMTAQYMNRPDVRSALHLSQSPQRNWPGPDDNWSYTSDWAACNPDAPPGTPSMIDFYRYLAPKLTTTLVYNGDTDPCVSYEGTRTAIERVGFKEVNGGSYRPWFYRQEATTVEFLKEKPQLFGPALSLVEGGPQYGGSVVDYENGLSFITVHGSGHMIPQFRPQPGLRMLDNLLSNRRFAPLSASDGELMTMSDKEFDSFLDSWTIGAKGKVLGH